METDVILLIIFVARRISAKMETVGSSVGLKTKSLFQALIDKTEQLKSKRNEYVEPADVAEKKVQYSCGYFVLFRKIIVKDDELWSPVSWLVNARIRRMGWGKVLFSQASVCLHPGGYPGHGGYPPTKVCTPRPRYVPPPQPT